MVTPQVFLVLCKKIYRYIIRILETCIFHEDATSPSLLTTQLTGAEILLSNFLQIKVWMVLLFLSFSAAKGVL